MNLSRIGYALLACASACGTAPDRARTPADAEPAAQSYVIAGTLVGHDGAAMKLAHVRLGDATVEAAADGSYRIEAPGPGFHIAEFTGVDHGAVPVGLWLDGHEVELDVTLGTYERPERLTRVQALVYDEAPGNKARPVTRTIPMTARPDGTFVAELEHPGGELIYQVLGAVQVGRSVNSTQADRYSYDGGGDYVSHVTVSGTTARLIFDPDALVPAGVAPRLVFGRPDSPTARIALIHHAHRRRVERFEARILSHGHAGDAGDVSWRGDIAAGIAREQHPQVRAALLIAYFGSWSHEDNPTPEARALAGRVLAEIPASSPLWMFEPAHVIPIVDATGEPDRHRDYLDDVLAHLPDTEDTARLMLRLLERAQERGRDDDLARHYAAFKRRFGHLSIASLAMRYDPGRKVRPGKPLPAFDLLSVDDGTTHITRDSLRGKVVFIELWATWCKPCVTEMPRLHQIHEAFRDQGFVVLSIATDDSAENVRAFREKWPMPWLNAVLDESNQDDIKRRFEVRGLPKTILVDPEGTIAAVDIRGGEITPMILRVLARTRAGTGQP